jgi:hypothetical protein
VALHRFPVDCAVLVLKTAVDAFERDLTPWGDPGLSDGSCLGSRA